MNKSFKICVVIVTYQIGKEIHKCFKSIKNQVDSIIIVDNGSDSNTLIELQALENKYSINLILNPENKGIAYALNQGIKYAIEKNYEWVLTLDHDSEATPEMVRDMIGGYDSLPENVKDKVMIITPTYIEKDLINTSTFVPDSKLLIREIDTEKSSGSLVKTQLFNIVGLYEEPLFIDYVDHEFCLRARKHGYKIVSVSNAYLLHRSGSLKRGKSFGIDFSYANYPPIRRYYITRNRLYVWKKYIRVSPKWVITDLGRFVKDFVKIVLCENDKFVKCKMVYRGIKDAFANRFIVISN